MRFVPQMALVPCMLLPLWASAADSVNEIFTKGQAKWSMLLEDTGSGTVAAAGMLGIAGDSVVTVENAKGLVTALKGLNVNGSKGTLALGITPARTSFAPMDLSTYAGDGPLNKTLARILGSTGIGYAQGQSKLAGADFDRRAFSLQTSWYLKAKDDPVLALADAAQHRCPQLFAPEKPADPLPPQPPAISGGETAGATVPKEVDATPYKKRFADCTKQALADLKWNRSIAALSVSRGWVRRADGSAAELSMGTAWTANLTIGFNPDAGWFDKGIALTIGHRRTRNEPVLATLASASPQRRNSSLTLVRLAGGSDEARLFFEASNAKASSVTESQRNFKRALGLDMRLMPEVWLNFRVGRQHSITGDKQETASLLSLSWSPKALMEVGSGK